MDPLINLSLSSIAASPSGKVTGGIWLRAFGHNFPEREWNDYPVVVLAWWLEAMCKLSIGSVAKAECNFMDGPWHFELEPAGASWRIRLVDGHKKGSARVVGEGLVPSKLLLQQTVTASRTVADDCRRRGWAPADLPALEAEIERAQARLEVMKQ